MREVNKKMIIECADNLLFSLSDQMVDDLVQDFENLNCQIDFLKAIDNIDDEIPTAYPYMNISTYLRKDVPEKPLPTKDVLKNVNNKFADYVKVSKVIGE